VVDVETVRARIKGGMTPRSTATDAHSVAAALAHCREVTRRCARNFYYGLKLSPEPQRSALYAIYAWMRRADDLVDCASPSDPDGLREQLSRFRAATDAALDGRTDPSDPLWIGLADTAKRFGLPGEHFHAMLDGQQDDVARAIYPTFNDLRGYCYNVASTVGLLCIEIWGYGDAAAREMAVDRGIAFQLTNILRDFAQDFDAGRIYLPQDELAAHNLTVGDLRAWRDPLTCAKFMVHQIDRAEGYYQRSTGLEAMITESCRPTLWAMTTIYHGLLRKMRDDPARLMSGQRVRLSAVRKGFIALQARWQARAVVRPAPRVLVTASRKPGF
jgi:phytoene synthase